MKSSQQSVSRRGVLSALGKLVAGAAALATARKVRAVTKQAVTTPAPAGYDPTKHQWRMALDVNKCIGCGSCADACKNENHVPRDPGYFRTWVERYIIKKAPHGSGEPCGETLVDSPNGSIGGFPPTLVPKSEILKAFHVPKLCNQCSNSPCDMACPVGATFRTPDGAVLVDPTYCIGCGFCVQACPYGCRFINPLSHTAEKCTFCYHRITRGLKPACAEVCPTGTRIFGDLKNAKPDDPLLQFYAKNRLQVLKPHLGTLPRVFYAGLDEEAR
ncbi:MAG: 4Fe-4S dicluster domain-containing protein [Verrucomicrobia bacterium]|nr:4Fe-4S dicluster domain-containing protein [Verrucomicrobiota bacterium]